MALYSVNRWYRCAALVEAESNEEAIEKGTADMDRAIEHSPLLRYQTSDDTGPFMFRSTASVEDFTEDFGPIRKIAQARVLRSS